MAKHKNKVVDENFLNKTYAVLNRAFFQNRLPVSVKIQFMKNCGYTDPKTKEWASTSAYYNPTLDMIFIDKDLRFFPDYIVLSLLHEMVHVDLGFQGYRGWSIDNGHGMKFHGEIVRLFNAGAYDGLL